MTDKFTRPSDAKEGHRWTLRNGFEFRLLEIKDDMIIGVYRNRDGKWFTGLWVATSGAVKHRESQYDLIDAPREHTVWVNVYRRDGGVFDGFFHSDRDEADIHAGRGNRFACKQITITEGEGL